MEVGFRSKVTVAPTYFKYKQSGPVTDQMYRDTMENVASYNSRLCHERRLRLPFLDSQTGVAQNHSNLWMGYRYRSPGVTQGQLYTYPAKRWRKKKRLYSQLEMTKAGDIETGEADMHAISAVENPAALITQLEPDLKEQVPHTDILYKDIWYDEMDAISEPPDAGEIENRNSDSSDYEETYIKRRRKKNKTKSTGRGRGKKSGDHGKDDLPLDKEKPYVCDTCGARYKTRPGLNYHLNHNHDGAFASTSDDTRSQSPTIPSLPPTGLSLFNTGTMSVVSFACMHCTAVSGKVIALLSALPVPENRKCNVLVAGCLVGTMFHNVPQS